MDFTKYANKINQGTKQAGQDTYNYFSNMFSRSSGPTATNTGQMHGPQPNPSLSTGASQGGTQTANNISPNTSSGRYGSPQIGGYFNTWQGALDAINARNNPPAVDINIDDTITSDALKGDSSATSTREKRNKRERTVRESRYQKEEEQLLKDIQNFRTGLAGLQSTQAQEMYDLEKNPYGALTSGLNAELGRLDRQQAIELNARTGQLNAMLDSLEMYQGYRPNIVGSPQIDEQTGEAFAYIQDPMTGELYTQSLGAVTTPVPRDPFTLSEGEAIVDPVTGEVVYKNPKTFAPKTDSGFSSSGSLFNLPADFDITDPTQIDQLPVSTITKAIMTGTGTIKDLTPTDKKQVLAEMYQVGFNPQQYVVNKLNNLVESWTQIPNSYKGLVQGRVMPSDFNAQASNFESQKKVLTRIVARLYDVGMLSDQDVLDYKQAMPSRGDRNLEVVKAKVSGLTTALTGKGDTQGETYEIGTEAVDESGRVGRWNGTEWVDPFTGQPLN